MSAARLYSLRQVRAFFFPGRSTRWIRDTFRGGTWGPVMRDSSGWLISEAAVAAWQAAHAVTLATVVPLRSSQAALHRS